MARKKHTKQRKNFTEYADLITRSSGPKQFLDPSGLKSVWNKLRSSFVSSSNGTYIKIETGDTKTISLNEDKLLKGVTNTGTSLATDGYIDGLIMENASSEITEKEINRLFEQKIRLFYGDTTNYPNGILNIAKDTTFSELKQIVEEKKDLDPSMNINYILSNRTQSIGYGNFDAIKKYEIDKVFGDYENFYDLYINGLFEDLNKVYVYSPYNLTRYSDNDVFNNNEQLYSSAITLDNILNYGNLSDSQYENSLIICNLFYQEEDNIDNTTYSKLFKLPNVEEMAEFLCNANKNLYNMLDEEHKNIHDDELDFFNYMFICQFNC